MKLTKVETKELAKLKAKITKAREARIGIKTKDFNRYWFLQAKTGLYKIK